MPKINSVEVTEKWLEVYNYYTSLSSDWKRELFLQNLRSEQQAYLKTLVESDHEVLDYKKSEEEISFLKHVEEHKSSVHSIEDIATENKVVDNSLNIESSNTMESIKEHAQSELLPDDIFYKGDFDEDVELEIRGSQILNNSPVYYSGPDYYEGGEGVMSDVSFDQSTEVENEDIHNHNISFFGKMKRFVGDFKHFFVYVVVFLSLSGLAVVSSVDNGNIKVAFANNMYPEYSKWSEFLIDTESMRSEDQDIDEDGISNIDEFYLGLDPVDPDENNNGHVDGLDVLNNVIYSEDVSKELVLLNLYSLSIDNSDDDLMGEYTLSTNKKSAEYNVVSKSNVDLGEFVNIQNNNILTYDNGSDLGLNGFAVFLADVEMGPHRLDNYDLITVRNSNTKYVYEVKNKSSVDFSYFLDMDNKYDNGQLNIGYIYKDNLWLIESMLIEID